MQPAGELTAIRIGDSSRENDRWEMIVKGPNGFERSYTLVGSGGEHHRQ